MERIKQKLSDVVHNWAYIGMITLFLFSVQPVTSMATSMIDSTHGKLSREELKAEQEKQLKREILAKYSSKVYGKSESLSDYELEELLWAVGFDGPALRTAWSIAKNESNGRPMAYNNNISTGDKSYGIFQINMLGKLGETRREKFDMRSNILLFDPTINAEIAYYMSSGGENWSAWSGCETKICPAAGIKEWYIKYPATIKAAKI